MTVVLYIVQALVGLMALGLFAGFSQTKHVGLLLAGIVATVAALISFNLMAWWPLAAGFVVLWLMRMLGLDPGAPVNPA